MLERYGQWAYRWRKWLVIFGLLCMVGGGLYARGVYSSLTQGGFGVPDSQSQIADNLVNAYLGGNRNSLVVLLSSSKYKVNDPTFRTAAEQLFSQLNSQSAVNSLNTYYSLNDPHLISNDQHSTYALVGLKGSEDQQASTVDQLRRGLQSPTLKVFLGGQAAVDNESGNYVQSDLAKAERYAIPITAILLVAIFGSLVAAALPLILGLYGIIGALVITRLVSIATDMSVYIINLITLLGLGLAIDYSLFIVSRFREEMRACQNDTPVAMAHTLNTAGRAVVFSACTVLVALSGLIIFPVGFLRSMGIGGSAAVLIALLGTLLFLPAILAVVGDKVNALSVKQLWRRGAGPLFNIDWSRFTRLAMRWPILTVVLTLAVLLVAGIPFLSIHFSNPDYRILPKTSQARQVGQALQSDFPLNTQTPIQIVIQTPGSPISPANLQQLDDYGQRIGRLPGVSDIQNPVGPAIQTPQQLAAALAAIQANPKTQAILAQFTYGHYALLNVIPVGSTNDKATETLVKQIRAAPLPNGYRRWVGGQTADLLDLTTMLKHDGVYALIVVFGAMLLLFFLMLGSLVVPLKTIVLNVLSLAAAFGALVWIFQQGHWQGLTGIEPLGGIDATQPVIIFALAFGLSMDYAIFLFSRIKEYFDNTGNTRLSIASGIQKTGGIITSAALLLIVVIGAFTTGRIVIMKEVALGLIIAVLVDVFIVRLLLIPASMTLLGRYNWWAPKPLRRLHARLGFKDVV